MADISVLRNVDAAAETGQATTTTSPPARGYFAVKRVIDLAIVVVLAPFVLLIVVILGAVIRLDSSGPAIFRQTRIRAKRIRRDGEWLWELQPFTFYKFRTMQAAADATPHREYLEAYIANDEEAMARLQPERPADSFKMVGDRRITRVGGRLRQWSLDELPQLWNVAKGDMSIVGPRPPIDYELESYTDRDKRRLAGPVGITGLWQVSGRSELSFPEMVELDLDYLEQRSIWLDLKIMFKTIGAIITRRGAG